MWKVKGGMHCWEKGKGKEEAWLREGWGRVGEGTSRAERRMGKGGGSDGTEYFLNEIPLNRGNRG